MIATEKKLLEGFFVHDDLVNAQTKTARIACQLSPDELRAFAADLTALADKLEKASVN